jgi:hypothetical protein
MFLSLCLRFMKLFCRSSYCSAFDASWNFFLVYWCKLFLCMNILARVPLQCSESGMWSAVHQPLTHGRSSWKPHVFPFDSRDQIIWTQESFLNILSCALFARKNDFEFTGRVVTWWAGREDWVWAGCRYIRVSKLVPASFTLWNPFIQKPSFDCSYTMSD